MPLFAGAAPMKLALVAVGGLLLCSLAHAQNPDMDKLLDKLTFTNDKASLPYRLLKPDDYDKVGNDRYPLVVFLHGIVGRGTDNKKQLRSGVEEFVKDATRKKHPCFLAVPQCPPDTCGVFSRIVPASERVDHLGEACIGSIRGQGRRHRAETDSTCHRRPPQPGRRSNQGPFSACRRSSSAARLARCRSKPASSARRCSASELYPGIARSRAEAVVRSWRSVRAVPVARRRNDAPVEARGHQCRRRGKTRRWKWTFPVTGGKGASAAKIWRR